MTDKPTPQKTGALNGFQKGLILGAFALLSTGLTTITWHLTKERIQIEKEKALLRAISDLIPAERFANDPYRDCTKISNVELLGSKQPQSAWRLRDAEQQPVGVVISSIASDGYNGAIELIVGHYTVTSTSSRLAGVRVTDHKETPGLGDKIQANKSNWILQFADIPTTDIKAQEWQVTKDGGQFDAFTGATITPRAVLKAIRNNIEYFRQHKEQIFSAPANCLSEQQEQTQGENESD